MQRIILTYGIISGAIVILGMILGMTVFEEAGFSELLGYAIMVVALTMIFLGVKRYRDRDLGGVIGFRKAALVGIAIAAVAGVIYVVVWEIHLAMTDHAFIEQYASVMIEKQEAAGVTGAELDAYREEMAQMKESYANPVIRVPMTFLEIFPVGLLIALVSAALLRRSSFLPATG